MAMSIKYKIRAGTIFLFLLLALTGGMSIYYLIKMRKEAAKFFKRQLYIAEVREGHATVSGQFSVWSQI